MEHNKNNGFKALRYLSLITQFGLSVATPPILCVLLALWLQNRFGIGDWVVIFALVVGLISSGCTFYNFIKKITNNNKTNGGGENEKD